ncbi:MAG TPA: hypothetical protein PK929_15265 [Quisquiliibacterium sp.]|nr:hypothetical protein [Quisquiliibacterium sp.]
MRTSRRSTGGHRPTDAAGAETPAPPASPETPAVSHRPALPARRALLISGAALLAGCATPQFVAPPAAPVPPPTVRVGDRWRYQVVDRYSGRVTGLRAMQVAALQPQLRVAVTDGNDRPLAEETYARPWEVVQEPGYDLVQIFTQPIPVVPQPIAVGASARISGAYRLPGQDDQYFWSEWIDAPGWERIRVPAGEFEALRIERRIAFTHSDRWRLSAQRSETLWYAPAVNRWVRREWTGNYLWYGMRRSPLREDWVAYELIDYAPAG